MVDAMTSVAVYICLMCTIVCIDVEAKHYATKTAYRNRHPLEGDWTEDNKFLQESCTPVHVTQLFRHGTRYPSSKQIKKINKLFARLLTSVSGRKHLPEAIYEWKNPFEDKELEEKPLSLVGEEEMIEMGRRFRERYEKRMMLVGENIRITTSNLSRAIHSSTSFLKGLKLDIADVLFEIKEKLVRFFAYCDRYKTSVKKNKTAVQEYYKFKKGPEVLGIVNNIKDRFLLKDIEFGPDDAELAFVMCGFEIANNISSHEESPWCQLLQPSDMKVLEYLQDVRQYWRKSYPYEVNIMQGCKLVADILHHLQDAKQFWDRPSSFMLYFGHAETVLPVIGLLNLLKEPDHLRADNFQGMHENRTFRTAAISPFSANLAIELYRCEGPKHWEYFVRPVVNESPVMWSLCDRSFCPYEKVKKLLRRCSPGYYDHDETCGLNSQGGNEKSEDKHEMVKDEL